MHDKQKKQETGKGWTSRGNKLNRRFFFVSRIKEKQVWRNATLFFFTLFAEDRFLQQIKNKSSANEVKKKKCCISKNKFYFGSAGGKSS